MRFQAIFIIILIMSFIATSSVISIVKCHSSPFNVVKVSWGNSQYEIDAAPGDKNVPLRVTFQNISNTTISGLSQILFLTYPFSNVTGGKITRSFYEGDIPPGGSATVQFILNIDEQATSGEYILKMTINYLELASGVGKTLYFLKSSEVNVPILISGVRYMIIYSILVYPPRVSSGGKVTVSGNILNTGSLSALNTNVTIISPNLKQSSFVFIGQVDPNIPRPFSIQLQIPAQQRKGQVPITIIVTYVDTLGVKHVSFAKAAIFVEEESPPSPVVERPKTFQEIISEILRRIWEVLFGSLSLVHILNITNVEEHL
ncbi:MAG: hypothetical protein QW589_05720 [Candidatus Bathyarchaeia archaeon]